jgi:hypothetical protein
MKNYQHWLLLCFFSFLYMCPGSLFPAHIVNIYELEYLQMIGYIRSGQVSSYSIVEMNGPDNEGIKISLMGMVADIYNGNHTKGIFGLANFTTDEADFLIPHHVKLKRKLSEKAQDCETNYGCTARELKNGSDEPLCNKCIRELDEITVEGQKQLKQLWVNSAYFTAYSSAKNKMLSKCKESIANYGLGEKNYSSYREMFTTCNRACVIAEPEYNMSDMQYCFGVAKYLDKDRHKFNCNDCNL